MKVTIDYFPGPDPDSVTYQDVKKITTVKDWGYVRLVLHRSVKNGGPLYLIKGIHIEEEVNTNGIVESDQGDL